MASRKRLFTAILVPFLILLAALVASEVLIPHLVNSHLKREIERRYPEADVASVSARAFPAFRLLFNHYSRLTCVAYGISLAGVTFDSLSVESREWPDASFTALLRQEEFNSFFAVYGSQVTGVEVVLGEDHALVSGTVLTAAGEVGFTARGILVPAKERMVFFQPGSLEVGGRRVPELVVEVIRSTLLETPIYIVRPELEIAISSISISGGMLEIRGSADLEKTLGITL